MTAQIFTFPGQPEPTTAITPEHYARVAQGIVANCSSYNLDPMVLAGAIVAVVEAQAAQTAATNYHVQAAQPLPAYCDPTNEFRGSKFDRDRDVADIAKLLRKDIAAARKDGSLVLPAHAKVSVRIDRYSMGCSIDVRVVGCTQAELWNAPDHGVFTPGSVTRTPMRNAAHKKLTELMDAYKRDNSDTMTDYYDVNFSGHVSFS